MKNFDKSCDYIIGKNVVKEILTLSPDKVLDIFTITSCSHKDRGEEIIALAKKNDVAIHTVTKKMLDKMADSESHQSFVAKIKKRKVFSLKEWLGKNSDSEKTLIVMLDNIQDPHNIGAILRSIECFGGNGVILSKNRGGNITPVVTKTSSGATEYIDIITVSNLATTVLQLQEEGYCTIVAEVGDKATSLHEVEFTNKTLLVMGSEAKGVQPLIKKYADAKVYINMKGRIDSLNVAQATSVFLYQWSC